MVFNRVDVSHFQPATFKSDCFHTKSLDFSCYLKDFLSKHKRRWLLTALYCQYSHLTIRNLQAASSVALSSQWSIKVNARKRSNQIKKIKFWTVEGNSEKDPRMISRVPSLETLGDQSPRHQSLYFLPNPSISPASDHPSRRQPRK